MSKAETTHDIYRLKWQCRRGMLELDLLLNEFLDNHYESLGPGDKSLFIKILEIPDQELIELLMGRKIHTDVETNELARKIGSQAAGRP